MRPGNFLRGWLMDCHTALQLAPYRLSTTLPLLQRWHREYSSTVTELIMQLHGCACGAGILAFQLATLTALLAPCTRHGGIADQAQFAGVQPRTARLLATHD
jgi:hypothetical protein